MARAAVIPPSPAKRGARGRSKGTVSTRPATGAAASTAAARAKAKTATAKATTEPKKRTARTGARSAEVDADEETDDEDEIGAIENTEQAKPVKSRGKTSTTTTRTTTTTAGRGRKPVARPVTPQSESDDDDELAQMDIPKKRVGRPRAKPQAQEDTSAKKQEPAPRPRGRPKGSTNAKSTTAKARTQTDAESSTEMKNFAIASAALRSNMLRGPAKKKTVTFQDMSGSEEEEESAPAPTATRRRGTPAKRQTGLAAKPARKPATTAGRGRKPVAKEPPKPLSPKKANQVTKSISSYVGSDGEDDELSGDKDQTKFQVASPIKHGSATTGLSSPVKRINLTPRHPSKSVDENGKPVRRSIDFNDIIMSSPTREPSPSPFHYTLRETPRKVGFPVGEHIKPTSQPDFAPSQSSPLKASPKKAQLETPRGGGLSLRDDMKPLSQPNFTPGENSPLKASPKKGHFGTPKASTLAPWDGTRPSSQPHFTPAQSSPLKTSPRKGNLAASLSQSSMRSSTPSFNPRISLFQSPAKRVASPFKITMTPRKPPVTEEAESTTPRDATPGDDRKLDLAAAATPEVESPLRSGELDEDMDEQSGDELSADVYAQPGTESQARCHEEMDEVAAVSDGQHESDAERESAADYVEDYEEAPIHESVEQDVPKSSPDFGGDVAQTFTEKDTGDHFETHVDYPEAHPEDHVSNGTQDHENYEDADDLVASVLKDFEDHAEELPAEPTSEHQVEYNDDKVETNAFTEAEMREEQYDEGPDQDDNGESDLAHQEQEPPLRQHTPEKIEDVFTKKSPAVESSHEDVASGDDIEMREPEGEDNHKASFHEENEESDDYSDGDDFVGYDETTLVGMDEPLEHNQTENGPSPDNVENISQIPSPPDNIEGVPLPNPSPPAVSDNHYRDGMDEKMDSDEDDQSDTGLETENQGNMQGINRPETPDLPGPSALNQRAQGKRSIFDNAPCFTPLAQRFSEWKTSIPEGSQQRRPGRRGVFSIGRVLKKPSGRVSVTPEEVSYPDLSRSSIGGRRKSALAEVVTQQDDEHEPTEPEAEQDQQPEPEPEVALKTQESPRQPMPEIFTDPEPEVAETDEHGEISHVPDSIPSQDASAAPAVAPSILESDDEKENENILSPTPAPAPVTPMKNKINPLQTFHTVSKVPLKGEGDVSPLKMPRKRGRSLSNTSPTRSSPRQRRPHFASSEESLPLFSPHKLPRVQEPAQPQRRTSAHGARSVERRQSTRTKTASKSPSPKKSPRKSIGGSQKVLQGAVVYVNVHTTEGEDASGIFVELLQQMGARCIRNWSWNPHARLSPDDGAEQKDSKVGITHVVFKDGGVRTLEKVRQAAGLVKCVGVGWVLDCERENKWLDEMQYAVDSSIIPRGGAKRRKSMEPRALSNINGTLVKADSATTSSSSSSSSLAGSRRQSGISRDEPQTPERINSRYDADDTNTPDQAYCQTSKTPGYRFNMDDYVGMSPATPFYLSRAKLVQRTCPPKQTREGLFPASQKSGDDEGSRKLRFKLEAARRKSLAYKPQKGSPLAE